jgi:hypothetical protein
MSSVDTTKHGHLIRNGFRHYLDFQGVSYTEREITIPKWYNGERGKYSELRFANGTIALVEHQSNRPEYMAAVKVLNPKRGHALHVNGQTHYKKWGKFPKGVGPVWAGRKHWKDSTAPAVLWTYCTGENQPRR